MPLMPSADRRRVGKIALLHARFRLDASGDFAHAVVSLHMVRVGKIAGGWGATRSAEAGRFCPPYMRFGITGTLT